MLLKVTHRTEYSYDFPVLYALQRARLHPKSGHTQDVKAWSILVMGAREEVQFIDQFGNDTRLLSIEGESQTITIEAKGEVHTRETSGVSGPHTGFAPLWLFQHETALTKAGTGVGELVTMIEKGTDLERLHRLMNLIGEKVAYQPGSTNVGTTAEDALASGQGVCQDHAHIFVSAARRMGLPARYVSGYLLMDGAVEQVATHAWSEAHVTGLGWVAFDVSNEISPDERYVRIATGRDYRDAMPISGIRMGQAAERLEVRITVEQ